MPYGSGKYINVQAGEGQVKGEAFHNIFCNICGVCFLLMPNMDIFKNN